MTTNAELTREYLGIIDELQGDIEGRRKAREYMKHSTAIVHHKVVDSTFIPKLFDKQSYSLLKDTAETAHRILCKVMQRYIDDPEYRHLFSFDERLVELILLPRAYQSMLPFARVDVFFDEETGSVRFCEFNGDGSSGMNEQREISVSCAITPSFKAFAQKHRIKMSELFNTWVDKFIEIYNQLPERYIHPNFAIVDYLENGVVDEFQIFAKLFKGRGISCYVVDVRDLRFDGNQLTDPEGHRIDAIWRRCVTNDVIEHWDESLDLINAVRAGKVQLIGSFAGHIVHDKQIFQVLHNPATHAFLTSEEVAFIERTVPFTAFLDEAYVDLADIKAHRERWIIKPTDAYAARDVYSGAGLSQTEWEEKIDRFANGAAGAPFIVQEYITPHRTLALAPDVDIDELSDAEVCREPQYYNNLSGLYLYDGQFAGVFSRLGPLPIISKDMKGFTAASVWVDCD